MPGPAAYCAACELGGRLFVFGGARGDDYLSEVVSFNPATNAWRAEKPLDFAREGSAAAALDGAAYLFGGRASDVLLPAAELYQPATEAPARGP
jgi:hypothetical protein